MIIDSYNFGKIVIDGRIYTSDVIILPDRVVSDWWRASGHNLVAGDIQKYISVIPDILLVGTGYFGIMKVSKNMTEYALNNDIELHIVKSGKIPKLYNNSFKNKKVAAAIHLSC